MPRRGTQRWIAAAPACLPPEQSSRVQRALPSCGAPESFSAYSSRIHSQRLLARSQSSASRGPRKGKDRAHPGAITVDIISAVVPVCAHTVRGCIPPRVGALLTSIPSREFPPGLHREVGANPCGKGAQLAPGHMVHRALLPAVVGIIARAPACKHCVEITEGD